MVLIKKYSRHFSILTIHTGPIAKDGEKECLHDEILKNVDLFSISCFQEHQREQIARKFINANI